MKTELTIAYVADAGLQGATQDAAVALIGSWGADAIVAVGDMYGYGAEPPPAEMWAPWLALGTPIYLSGGNHEWDGGYTLDDHLAVLPDQPGQFGHQRYGFVELGDGLLHLALWHSGRKSDWTDVEPDGRDVGSTQYNNLTAAAAASRAWWRIAAAHHPPEAKLTGSGRVEPGMAHLVREGRYDLTLWGHSHQGRELLQNGYWSLNVSSAATPRALEASQGITAETCDVWEDGDERRLVTRLRVTPEAIRWDIFDTGTGAIVRTGGTGALRGRGESVLHAPLSLPVVEGGGALEHTFKHALWTVAKRRGLAPDLEQLQDTDAITITAHLESALKWAWEFYDWPCVILGDDEHDERTRFVPETGGDGRRWFPHRAQTRTSGWREIGQLLGAWGADGRALCVKRTPAGFVVTSALGTDEEITVRYRRLPIRLGWEEHDPGQAYPRDAVVYDPASGHSYRAYDGAAEGDAVTDAAVWERQPIPYELCEPACAGAEALALHTEGQFDSAQVLALAMQSLLEHEIIQLDGTYGKASKRHR